MHSNTSDKNSNAIEWIINKRREGFTWEQIKKCCVEDTLLERTFKELKVPGMVIPIEMDLDEWNELVCDVSKRYIEMGDMHDTVTGIYRDNGLVEYRVPEGEHDGWRQYVKLLSGQLDSKRRMSDESIRDIQVNCHWLLNRIRKETRECGPQKGLVMGSVQSGKTANMIGLVTMAAHYDWNFIIVLSGSIENLRIQTRDRFMRDLIRCQDADWHFLESSSDEDFLKDLSSEKTISLRDARLNFSEPNTEKRSPYYENYILVCLKQASRLKKLIHWLHSDINFASRLRIVIIDDEADQASINTAKMTDQEIDNRTKINQLIIRLANGLDEEGKPSRFQALNYIAFTATPYANVLNEAYRESLYPKDFVMCLPENLDYFGPKVIWGSKKDENYPGLDIVRLITKADNGGIKNLGKGYEVSLPDSLKDSISWFLCCIACIRTKNIVMPVSMLIHTSAGNKAHFYMYEAIRKWISEERAKGDLVSRCRKVYERETSLFTFDKFSYGYSQYAGAANAMKEYPGFDDLVPEITDMLSEDLQTIEIVGDGELRFSETAIHLCVDNYSAPRYEEEGTQLRIVYPDSNTIKKMNKAPAFIVIGGNTLSRGLTIEGLVCTYFTRSSNQADTLMQMARWYGYRKGYELLPRIWMTEESANKYRLLQEVDEKLRKTLADYKEMGKDPGKIYPAVMSTSSIARFLLTSKNKSQNMVPCDMDYSGDSYEATEFSGDDAVLRGNLKLTENFLREIGEPQKSMIYPDRSLVWRGIPSKRIIEYLNQFSVFSPTNFSNQIKDFIFWLGQENDKQRYLKWNVAVCGASTFKHDKWTIEGINYPLGKVERTKLKKVKSHIDIGSLRSGRDGICDIILDETVDESLLADGKKGKKIEVIRGKLGYSDVPLLLLYCVYRNGGKETDNNEIIGTEVDLVAYSVVIGGDSSGTDHVESVVVSIPDGEDEDDTEE